MRRFTFWFESWRDAVLVVSGRRFGWNQWRIVVPVPFLTTSMSIMKAMKRFSGSIWPFDVSSAGGTLITGADVTTRSVRCGL